MEYLLENEKINIKCFSEIESVNINPKISIIIDKDSNTANKPAINITNYTISFIIIPINGNESYLKFIATIFFTNELFIRILFDTKIKKIDFKLLGYDYNKSKFTYEKQFLYLYNYFLEFKEEFTYDQYLDIIDESNTPRKYKIKINNINYLKGIYLLNQENDMKGINLLK